MAVRYTEEQLNTVDKSLLIQMFLNQQEQLETLTTEVRSLNEKMQLMMEQLVLANRNRFGRSSEKMEDASQISFMEVDGTIIFFNEAEAVYDPCRNRNSWRNLFLTLQRKKAKRIRICQVFLQNGSIIT